MVSTAFSIPASATASDVHQKSTPDWPYSFYSLVLLPNTVITIGNDNARAAATQKVASEPRYTYTNPISGGPMVCPNLSTVEFKDIKAARYSSGASSAIDVRMLGPLVP